MTGRFSVPTNCHCNMCEPRILTPRKCLIIAAAIVGCLVLSLSGCATFRADVTQASQQCSLSQHVKDAGIKLAPYEAKAANLVEQLATSTTRQEQLAPVRMRAFRSRRRGRGFAGI